MRAGSVMVGALAGFALAHWLEHLGHVRDRENANRLLAQVEFGAGTTRDTRAIQPLDLSAHQVEYTMPPRVPGTERDLGWDRQVHRRCREQYRWN